MIHTPQFPLKIGDKALFEQVQETKNVVFFHLRNLLLTSPGEKISDPDYGVGLRRFLFENLTTGFLNNLVDTIDEAIRTYLIYIEIIRITVESPPDSNAIKVSIAFEIPDLDIVEEFVIDVSDT